MAVVIIVKTELQEDNFIWGPFTNEEHATWWAQNNLKGLDWHWLPMERPGSAYLTANTSDIEDFIQTTTKTEDCYVTVDDANWVIPKEEG